MSEDGSIRTNVSFSPEIERRADAIMDERGISGVSELYQVLVREEFERRHVPAIYDKRPAPGQVVATKPVNYRARAKRGKGKAAAAKPEASSSSKMDTEGKIVDIIRKGSSGPKPGDDPHPGAKK